MTGKRHKAVRYGAAAEAGAEGRFEIGQMMVEDPVLAPRRVKVAANIRHDVLVHWRARKQIDDVQFLAGQKLQALWFRAGTGRPAAMRWDRDRVDGGLRADPFSEQVAGASAELRAIAAFLGRADYRLVIRAICEGYSIDDLAREVEGREPQRYIARRVRDALSGLADFWGSAGPGGMRHMPSAADQASPRAVA